MTKNKIIFLLPILSLFIFFFLRLSNLNAIPVFVDEAIYVRWSQVMKAEPTLRFLPMQDGKPPLFMWLTMPYLKFFSDPLIATRIVSVTAGLLSLLGVAFLTQHLFANLTTSFISTIVYSLTPFSVFFDRMALADSLLSAFGIWSIALAIQYAKSRKLEHAMFLGFTIGLGLLTKSPAIFFYAWLILALFFFKPKIKSNPNHLLISLIAIIFISQGMYSVLRLGPGFSQINARNQDYVFSFSEVLTHPLNPLIANLKTTFSWFWYLFTPGLLIPLALSAIFSKTKKQHLFIFLVCLLPLITQASIAKVYTSRYILFASIPFIPLVASGFFYLLSRKGLLIKFSALIILLPLYFSLLFAFDPTRAPLTFDMRNGYLEEWTAGWGQKEIAGYITEKTKEGRKAVVFTEGYFGTLPEGIQIYTEGNKDIIIVGSPPSVDKIPEGLLNTSEENLRFFVLNKSRNKLPKSEQDKLTLLKEFDKSQRQDGTHETLQFFQY